MKRIFLVTSCILISLYGLAAVKPKPTILVRDFETNLKNWCETSDPIYHNRIKDMCEVSTRCSDEIAMEKATYPGKDQDLDSYLKIFSDISNYNPSIRFSETKDITLNNCRTQEDKKLRSVYTKIHVSCSKWGKAINEEAVFYINESDKIVYIGDYLSESCKDCACAPPFEVLDMQFYFTDKDGTKSEWGATKGDNGLCQWVYARIKIQSKRNFDNFKLYQLIYLPDGKKMQCGSCNVPSQYTLSSIINITEGDNWYDLIGFGYSDGSYTNMGTYKYEVWYGNQVLIRREFEIGKPYASKISTSSDHIHFKWNDNKEQLVAVHSDGEKWDYSYQKYGNSGASNRINIRKKDYGLVITPQPCYGDMYNYGNLWENDTAVIRIKSGKITKDVEVSVAKRPAIIPTRGTKIGGGYTYSSLYPLNTAFPFALNFNIIPSEPDKGYYDDYKWLPSTAWIRFISYALEIGGNFDSQAYPLSSSSHSTYDPQAYMIISPGLYLRYITFQCGLGVMFGNYDGQIDLSTSFMLQPAIIGHIPIHWWTKGEESHYITLKVGYNITPEIPEMNGLCLGIGLQFAN